VVVYLHDHEQPISSSKDLHDTDTRVEDALFYFGRDVAVPLLILCDEVGVVFEVKSEAVAGHLWAGGYLFANRLLKNSISSSTTLRTFCPMKPSVLSTAITINCGAHLGRPGLEYSGLGIMGTNIA